MAPKKREHSNGLRTLIIQHYQHGDSLSEIAPKTSLSRSTVQYMVDKYKSTKCIGNLFGRGRKRKTRATTKGKRRDSWTPACSLYSHTVSKVCLQNF